MNNFTIHDLCVGLRGLLDIPDSDVGLKNWYIRAGELVAQLRQKPELADLIPIRVWQFLSDADIRSKDPQYAEAQLNLIAVFMQGLDEGVVLSADQIDERLDSPWP